MSGSFVTRAGAFAFAAAVLLGVSSTALARQTGPDDASQMRVPGPTDAQEVAEPFVLQTDMAPQDEALPPPPRQAGARLPFAPTGTVPGAQAAAPPLLSLQPLPPLPAPPLETNALDQPTLGPTQTQEIARDKPAQIGDALDQGSVLKANPTLSLRPMVVQAQQLSSQDVASIGVLTQDTTGFSTQIWSNSRARDILNAWSAVPVTSPSPTINAAVRDLALAVAAAPPVSDARAWTLLEKRVDVLGQIGDLPGALALLARAPSDLAPNELLKKKAEAALWAQDWTLACDAARIGLNRGASAYWTNISLACHAVAGNRPAVELLLDVLGPGERPTRQFMAAIYGLLDVAQSGAPIRPAEPEPLDPNGALLNAIAAQRGISPVLDPSFIDQTASVHASIAHSGRGDLASRWPAFAALAYRARLQKGAMIQFALAVNAATPADPSLGMAIGPLQQALYVTSPQRRVSALLDLSAQARRSGMSHFWAPAVGGAVTGIEPDAALWPDAGPIAAHLAFAGEGRAVGRWYSHIRTEAQGDDLAAAQSLISVWPYAILLAPSGDVPFTTRLAQLWLQTQSGGSAQEQAKTATYFYIALEALGYSIAPEVWAEVEAAGGYVPEVSVRPADLAALERIASRGEVGRGILRAFAILGADGPVAPDPQALRAALRALVQLGQDAMARQIAAEVMFFNGVSLGNGS